MVDNKDYAFLMRWKWQAKPHGYTFYAVRTEKKKRVAMHRVIANAPLGMSVDHKDRNGLNNARKNLVVCTHAENCRNRINQVRNTSGARGVIVVGKRYRAKITIDRKAIHLGYFASIEEASAAYQEARKKLFNNFNP